MTWSPLHIGGLCIDRPWPVRAPELLLRRVYKTDNHARICRRASVHIRVLSGIEGWIGVPIEGPYGPPRSTFAIRCASRWLLHESRECPLQQTKLSVSWMLLPRQTCTCSSFARSTSARSEPCGERYVDGALGVDCIKALDDQYRGLGSPARRVSRRYARG
jgi:hypothetical protein